MSRVRFLRCQLCKRMVACQQKQRVLGNQSYFFRLRGYRTKNYDPITGSGIICGRCHESLGSKKLKWLPPTYMEIQRCEIEDPNGEMQDVEQVEDLVNMEESDQQVPGDPEPIPPVENINMVPEIDNNNAANSESSNSSAESQLTGISTQCSSSGTVQVHTIPASQRKCCICKSENGRSAIPKSAVVSAWLDTRVMVPFRNRACNSHFENNALNTSSLEILQRTGT